MLRATAFSEATLATAFASTAKKASSERDATDELAADGSMGAVYAVRLPLQQELYSRSKRHRCLARLPEADLPAGWAVVWI